MKNFANKFIFSLSILLVVLMLAVFGRSNFEKIAAEVKSFPSAEVSSQKTRIAVAEDSLQKAQILAGSCIGFNCTVNINDTLALRIYAIDEFGNIISGTTVSYAWTISPAALGVFTQNNSTTYNTSTTYGYSNATLKTGMTIINGAVKVEVSYGGKTKIATFNIGIQCGFMPLLYPATATISFDGTNYYSSEAEILYTFMSGCLDEYKLKRGVGEIEMP